MAMAKRGAAVLSTVWGAAGGRGGGWDLNVPVGPGCIVVIPTAVVSELSCWRDERDLEELLLEASQDAGQEPP